MPLLVFRSIDEAWRAFDHYARVEPRLRPLWDLCLLAAPPRRVVDDTDDDYGVDPFEADVFAEDKPENGWCAEDYFHEHVKSKLMLLVGTYRLGEPHHQLHSPNAYEEIYDLLINSALHRPCACCAERPWHPPDGATPGDISP